MRTRFSFAGLTVLFACTVAALAQETAAITPTELRCEYTLNPLGVDVLHPRLSWFLQPFSPALRDLAQSGYEVLVASSPERLAQNQGDLWDSGHVQSGQMNQLPYKGSSLSAGERCCWKVRVWDGAGHLSPWSAPAEWTMGPMAEADWAGAKWIGAPAEFAAISLTGPKAKYETVLLRDDFSVKPGLRRAVVFICGLGQFEMTLNGQQVGTDFLSPGWTQYSKTCLYCAYDVSGQIRPGANALGLLLGNGMYVNHKGRYAKGAWAFGPLQAIARLRLEYADGSVTDVVTDDKWRTLSGPITFSSNYGGEDYDLRLEPAGWNQAGFNSSQWDRPSVQPGPGGVLKGQSASAPPLRLFQTLVPTNVRTIKPGEQVYDFGQNTAMVIKLVAQGEAGAAVRVMPAELVNGNGTVNRRSAGGGVAYWQYTLAGTGRDEVYLPKFFYQGARYLQVDLLPAPGHTALPEVKSLESRVVHADCPSVGTFSCSNDLFNKTYTLVRWAQMSNMVSVMTDCPTRERLGWLEEDHLNGPALRYNFDLAQLFTKTSHDMSDSQRADGLIPSTCPDYMHWNGDFADSPEWGSSCVLVPWQQYEFEGDVELLRRNYDVMKRYLAFLRQKSRNSLLDYGLSDWYDIGPKGPGRSQLTPKALSATAYYFKDAEILAQVAHLLGHDDESTQFSHEANQVRTALNQALFHPDTHEYGQGSQCGNSLALAMNFADPSVRDDVFHNVVSDVQTKGLTAGDVGYRYLLRTLADGGRSDLIYAINNQSAKPGYGFQLSKGATSLTEAWNTDGASSQNHFMLGQINEWFFHDLGGIQCDPTGPGFATIIIKPAVVGDLTWVKTSYHSIRGSIESNWKRDGNLVTLHVSIPPNTTATVLLPDGSAGRVIGSGTYDFTCTVKA